MEDLACRICDSGHTLQTKVGLGDVTHRQVNPATKTRIRLFDILQGGPCLTDELRLNQTNSPMLWRLPKDSR